MSERTIWAKLVEARANMSQPELNAKNPHFGNRYADLSEIIKCINKPLTDAGMTYMQVVKATGDGAFTASLHTYLIDASGMVEVGDCYPLAGGSAQQRGSELTYAKRYTLAALFGLAAGDDDDGSGANKPPKAPPKGFQKAPQKPPKAPDKPQKNPYLTAFRALAEKYQSITGMPPAEITARVSERLGKPLHTVSTDQEAAIAEAVLQELIDAQTVEMSDEDIPF
jgi:hypothetical protein